MDKNDFRLYILIVLVVLVCVFIYVSTKPFNSFESCYEKCLDTGLMGNTGDEQLGCWSACRNESD